MATIRDVEINGARIARVNDVVRLYLPPTSDGYANAQIDDYANLPRRRYPWQVGTSLSLRARFSENGPPIGTAGFGLWNAPFADRMQRTLALPRAAWFFYGGMPNNLPLATDGEPGRGWFAATIEATTPRAWSLAPAVLPVVLLNQWARTRRVVWPWVQRRLGIHFQRLDEQTMHGWARYTLRWLPDRVTFSIDDDIVLQAPVTLRGRMAFVAWIDNQYLIATPRGRMSGGVVTTREPHWLEIADLTIR